MTRRSKLIAGLAPALAACASVSAPAPAAPPAGAAATGAAEAAYSPASDAGAVQATRRAGAERGEDPIDAALREQELAFAPAGAADRARMVAAAQASAEREPSTVHLLLFARVDPDRDRARETLKRAATGDRRSPWPQYALAHLEARAGNWSEAQRHLDLALDLDPDHAPSRRLEAALYARAGRSDRAIDALVAWLAATRGDARVDRDARAAARLDLAQLHLLDGEDAKALAVLRDVADEPIDSPRALALLAAVEQARGQPERALEAARAGERADPAATLPLVQQALLFEHHLKDPEAACAAWRRVLEVAERRSDLAALVAIVRARVALERAESDAARSKP